MTRRNRGAGILPVVQRPVRTVRRGENGGTLAPAGERKRVEKVAILTAVSLTARCNCVSQEEAMTVRELCKLDLPGDPRPQTPATRPVPSQV